MNESISIYNFFKYNRDRIIGNSLYRICRNTAGKWYILEIYNSEDAFSVGKGYFTDDLQSIIDRLNSFSKEREIISLCQ